MTRGSMSSLIVRLLASIVTLRAGCPTLQPHRHPACHDRDVEVIGTVHHGFDGSPRFHRQLGTTADLRHPPSTGEHGPPCLRLEGFPSGPIAPFEEDVVRRIADFSDPHRRATVRENVRWVTPPGELTASMAKRSSSPSRPSHRRTPRPRTIGRDDDVHVVDQIRRQELPDGGRSAADAHVESARGLPGDPYDKRAFRLHQ